MKEQEGIKMRKLVTISREYGSGGRIIGKLLAEKLKVPFYDKEIIDMAVEQSGYSREIIEGAELKAKRRWMQKSPSCRLTCPAVLQM